MNMKTGSRKTLLPVFAIFGTGTMGKNGGWRCRTTQCGPMFFMDTADVGNSRYLW